MTGAELPLLSADFQVIETFVPIVSGVFQLAPQNPARWGIMFANPTANSLTISTRPDVTTSAGFQLSQTNSPLYFHFRSHGGLVSVPWFAVSSIMGNTVTVIEVLYRPGQGGRRGVR